MPIKFREFPNGRLNYGLFKLDEHSGESLSTGKTIIDLLENIRDKKIKIPNIKRTFPNKDKEINEYKIQGNRIFKINPLNIFEYYIWFRSNLKKVSLENFTKLEFF